MEKYITFDLKTQLSGTGVVGNKAYSIGEWMAEGELTLEQVSIPISAIRPLRNDLTSWLNKNKETND